MKYILKTFHSKLVILFCLWIASAQISLAQVDQAKANWLIPDYLKLQYAGGIGFLSAGLGYTFVHDRIDATLFYGYVPKSFSIDELHSISIQFTAKLIHICLSENYQLLPLNFGWYLHHTFGNEYWVKLPEHYPPEYYWWSPGRNAGIFVGGEIKTKWLASKTPASGIALYARIGTRGLYLASKYGNSSIPLYDIIELGFGISLYR